MSKPLTRTQIVQNRAFLRFLARSGNVRLAAREAGVAHGTVQHRRRVHAGFARRWDAAVAVAEARLHLRGTRDKRLESAAAAAMRAGGDAAPPGSESGTGCAGDGRDGRKRRAIADLRSPPARQAQDDRSRLRTAGGEPVIVRTRDGRLQVRPAHPGKLTKAAEQAFLAALSATCNVRLSAAAAGASARAFYRRKEQSPGFAREWRLALTQGHEGLTAEMFAAGLAGSHEDDAWRHNEPPAIPPMSPNQALQLLYLHQKEARLWHEPDYMKRRRGESREAQSMRLGAMYEARLQRDREAYEVAEAARREARERKASGEGAEAEMAPLPDLAQVTGWSKASGKPPHHPGRALFGGWRIADMEKKRRG